MLKKISLLALVSACSMSYAAAPEVVRTEKVRLVTLGDREVALILEAHQKALEEGKEAPLIAQYAERIAAGDREVSRDERNELLQEALSVIGRESHLFE